MKQTVKEKLEELLSKTEADYLKCLERFNTNIDYQFAWSGEELFKSANMIKQLKNLLEEIKDATDVSKEKIITYLTDKVMKTPLMDRSSGQLHSLTSLWTREVTVKIVEELKWY